MLVAAPSVEVGVDVMKLELRRNTTLQQFFSHMTRQFTEKEWESIQSPATDQGKLFNFYRHWCLKESFVKTIGTGLKFGLKRIQFSIGPMEGDKCFSTTVAIDGTECGEWRFVEILHDHHIIATAIKGNSGEKEQCVSKGIEVLTFQDLAVSKSQLEDSSYFAVFNAKQEFPC